jgi:hypothetical protein
MDEPPQPPPNQRTARRWTSRLMFVDPSGGQINGRILTAFLPVVVQYADASDKQKKEFSDLLIVLCLKLTAVWTHLKRYSEHEDAMVATGRAKPIDSHASTTINIATAQDLYMELDGFLVQFKSALDCMIKAAGFGLRLSHSELGTFGDKGNGVAKVLKNNLPNKLKGLGKELTKLISSNQTWLSAAIDLRNRMNHYQDGGLSVEAFVVVVRIENGKEIVWTPQLSSKQTVREGMTNLFSSLLDFVDVFVGLALVPRLRDCALYRVPAEEAGPISPRWKVVQKPPDGLGKPIED